MPTDKALPLLGMVLVTHGRLAEEMVTAMEHVVGPQRAIATVCIGPNDNMEMRRKEIADAAGQSNRFLDRPVRAMSKDTGVGADLAELRRTIEDLDPGKKDDLFSKKKLFGIIPYGNKMRNYFDSYKSSQGHIASILTHLGSGKDELIKDNAAISVERQNLWAAMGRLEQMIHIAKALDARLEEKAADLDISDPAKAKAIRETALFYIRQRTQDLLTQMAVTVQGYLALDLVKKNNVELIKGVDRASTTTVAALRTAVTVAQALVGQKLVLDQITALNTTTANIIDSTGEMLKNQTAQIHEQAASSTIPIETLQRAFQNIYLTMDNIDTFKAKALVSMKTTVDTPNASLPGPKRHSGATAWSRGLPSAHARRNGGPFLPRSSGSPSSQAC